MNHINNIQVLLDKYFEGATSLQEERDLKAYFNGTAVDEEVQMYQHLFQYFEASKKTTLSADFQEKLAVQLNPKTVKLKPRAMRNRWLAIAASLALLLTTSVMVYYWQQQNSSINWAKYEVENPEEALDYTKAALELLASKLNSGAAQAAQEVDKIGTINQLLKK